MQSENAVTSYVGRWVAFFIIPIVGALTAWLGAHGLDLDPAEVTAWVIGVVGAGTTWLYNRGKYEVAKATGLDEATIQQIVETTIREKLPPAPSDSSGRNLPPLGAPPGA
jgi:hypothetical protein